MERTRGKPSIDLATIRSARDDQAADLARLRQMQARRDEAHASLPVEGFTAEYLAAQRERIDAGFADKAKQVLERMEGRAHELEPANAAWAPAARRLGASLQDPIAASALAQRLATVGAEALRPLIRQAVNDQDWLLGDALAQRVEALGLAPEDGLGRELAAELGELGAADAAQVSAWVQSIGADLVLGRVAFAEGKGQPLSMVERMGMARKYPGARMTEPALQEANG